MESFSQTVHTRQRPPVSRTRLQRIGKLVTEFFSIKRKLDSMTFVNCFMYFIAFFLNLLTFASTGFVLRNGTYLAQTNFNHNHIITGMVNGEPVDNLSGLRFGVWSACYKDSQNPAWITKSKCLPITPMYELYIQTDSTGSVRILWRWVTLALTIIEALATFFSLLAVFCTFSLNHWIAFIAMVVTLTALLFDGLFWVYVRNPLDSLFGESVTTILGTSFYWTTGASLLLIGGWSWQMRISRDIITEEEEEKKEKEETKNREFFQAQPGKITFDTQLKKLIPEVEI